MKKMLIIDDDRGFTRLLAQLLERKYGLYIANGVQEARSLLPKISLDAICSDYNMPDGTGLDLLKELRENGNSTPFLLMSADDEYSLEAEAKKYNALFCSKISPDFPKIVMAFEAD